MQRNERGINNAQRKAFAELAKEEFRRVDELIREKNNALDEELEEVIKKQLGADVLEDLIKAKEREIEELGGKLKEITGTDDYRYSGHKIKKEKDRILSIYDEDIRNIQGKKTEIISKIWASNEREEVVGLLGSIKGFKDEAYKKLDDIRPKIIKGIKKEEVKALN